MSLFDYSSQHSGTETDKTPDGAEMAEIWTGVSSPDVLKPETHGEFLDCDRQAESLLPNGGGQGQGLKVTFQSD